MPGPLGLLTILPDMYAIWRVQAQLVADIAAVYGKTGNAKVAIDLVLVQALCSARGG